MPERLLPLLTETPRSGDELGEALGLGRVMVNTLAHRLRGQGVPLEVGRTGYALQRGTPAPGMVPIQGQFGQALRYYGEIDSTQDTLRTWANDVHDSAPHGAVVVAERQRAGRGRRGRSWLTAEGSLVFSLLLRGPLPLAALPTLPLAAGVALRRAAGGGGLKWPNDLLDNQGRKVAGILLEAELRGEEARQAVLGIGINVSEAPEGAGNVHSFRPGVTRAELLGELLAALEYWLNAPADEVLDAWRAVSVTLGRPVQFTPAGGGPRTGTAVDIDAQGSLLVALPGGVRQVVSAGDVELVGQFQSSDPGNVTQ
ncbi:biotin--[acetyl-CoA-carboxylase] ligase [Deinococcus radiophilus]|uniref:biotin--[biotin carboxyl-carrier protein] ligase n=1 Tax=Deinococcus radiophilus TaxID=32062 RepID=A0A3S0RKS4_9DEIO|nr:biotin--[acetyl-CoA-carboxylase] ligase [Deinococcus radiophilus]RTR30847.1 biotin--[acetyl-CoA-carboxylase] ligase [Deinococcus radiophilus]UFA49428.1 biotin--[acetyl-CoA-carboxylase] ligase [Deinococcus radiophilus]